MKAKAADRAVKSSLSIFSSSPLGIATLQGTQNFPYLVRVCFPVGNVTSLFVGASVQRRSADKNLVRIKFWSVTIVVLCGVAYQRR